jgi:hypothetical protein
MVSLSLVYVFTFVLLMCCWGLGSVSVRKKVLLTGLYAACWGIGWVNPYFGAAAQCALALVLVGVTFGLDWLMRRH